MSKDSDWVKNWDHTRTCDCKQQLAQGHLSGCPDRKAVRQFDIWKNLGLAIKGMLGIEQIAQSISNVHTDGTPERFVKAYQEFFAGCWEDPKEVLDKKFEEKKYNEMVYVNDIKFVSFCAHHLVPFMGRVHFAYIPNKYVVGLSKIPRLVEVFARRPQVQEKLTQEIVDTFDEVIKPQGCGIVVEATHMCMAIRGVKKDDAYMRTTALRGSFLQKEIVRQEFLDGIRHGKNGAIWP